MARFFLVSLMFAAETRKQTLCEQLIFSEKRKVNAFGRGVACC